MQPVFKNSILVELNVATVATGQKYNFLDVPQLRGKYIHAIEAFSDSHLTKTPQGNTVIANAAIKDVLLVLVVGEEEKIQKIPYYTLVSSANGGFIRMFNNMQVNIVKSYIQLVSNNMTNGHSVVFNFYYKDQIQQNAGKSMQRGGRNGQYKTCGC